MLLPDTFQNCKNHPNTLTKDPKCASSYRPISLLSSIGKIFERIIRDKLNNHLTDHSIISDEQFGFREEHSTVHQIKRIVGIIKRNKRNRKSTGMVLLDIEKAFDSVWHNGLLYKLKVFRTPIYLIKLIASFLRDRYFLVELWTAFTSDLKIPRNFDAGYYADDTAIIVTAKQSNTIIRTLEKGLVHIHKYFSKWKIKINCDKTQAILFKFNRARRRNPTIPLTFNGSTIRLDKEVNYLGATIDDKTNFNSHNDACTAKAMNSFKSLYPILHSRSKLSTQLKLTLYKSIIRPKITYASPAWDGISYSNTMKL